LGYAFLLGWVEGRFGQFLPKTPVCGGFHRTMPDAGVSRRFRAFVSRFEHFLPKTRCLNLDFQMIHRLP
jgi:hypothetical protein